MSEAESAPEPLSLSDRGIVRSILVFGIPLVLGMGFHALFNLVDLWIVGKLGTAALAAVTIASMINTIPMVICNGISTSSIAFIARNIGFRNFRRANEVMRQSFILTVFLSIVLGVIPYVYARELVILLQAQGEDVIGPATEYLQVASLGTITMFLIMQITAALRSAGDGLWPMILLIGANILNVVLDVALVWGKWGFPEMGAAGASYATVISRAVFCVPGLYVLFRGKGGLKLSLARLRLRVRIMLQLIRVGIPASAQWVIRVLAYIVILSILGDHDPVLRPGFGKTAQAAFGIGFRLDILVVFAGFGWGAAASTLVGQNLGRGRPDRAETCTWVATGFNVLMMAMIGAAYFVFAPNLIEFFGADTDIYESSGSSNGAFVEVISVGTTYLRVIVFSYIFIAISLVVAQALNGAASTRTPMVIDALGLLLLQIPLAFALSRNTDLGLNGVWYAIVGSNALMAVMYVVWFKVGFWKRKEIW